VKLPPESGPRNEPGGRERVNTKLIEPRDSIIQVDTTTNCGTIFTSSKEKQEPTSR
jgi:hypothetical protein